MSDPFTPSQAAGRDLPPAERRRSVLAEGNVIKGEWVTEGITELGGTFRGDLQTDTLVLTRTGRIEGTVRARNVTIEGTLIGTVSAQSVTIRSSAAVTADITCDVLSVDPGSAVEGRFTCRPEGR